ncbi:MAG: glycosyl transferase family 1 [Acidobacteria bacterium SCN 69-37]|nr:MAG: glycosyl transferase family 1 [Acidobacteria bacterium SCN 69-37]
MRITLLTNEYPPHVYGGAGVHVEYLTRELAALDDHRHQIDVRCFGDQYERHGNLSVTGIAAPPALGARDPRHAKFFDTAQRNLAMAAAAVDLDIVHCHTWYAHLAGCLVKQLAGVPLVLTTHSLEPHRPWKAEQLGTAYQASTWVERTAYQNADGVVAVSQSMRRDVHDLYGVPFDRIRVIHNGIDLDEYRPTLSPETLEALDIDPAIPYVLFVGRITRQKGIIHLVHALRHLTPGMQVVLCAGAPDTPEIAAEMTEAVERARAATTSRVVWISDMLPKPKVIALYTHAAVFVCPSVYEPFGIINLEAMACETPVVASAVGGIPEVVDDGRTGLLVPIDARSSTDVEPRDPERFARDLATAINTLMADPARRADMAARARDRVEREFSWRSIARKTLDFYDDLAGNGRNSR